MKNSQKALFITSLLALSSCSLFGSHDNVAVPEKVKVKTSASELLDVGNDNTSSHQNRYLKISKRTQIQLAVDAAIDNEVDSMLQQRPTNNTLYFSFDTASVAVKWSSLLQEQSAFLKKFPTMRVVVAGFTDLKGSAKYNYKLGLRRSNQVCNELIKLGVHKTQLRCVSYGATHPADPGKSSEAMARNRRVEFIY